MALMGGDWGIRDDGDSGRRSHQTEAMVAVSKMKIWFYQLVMLGAFLLVVFWSGLAGQMTADRATPVAVLESTLLTPEVPQGGLLRVSYIVRRDRVCKTLLERVIIDSNGNRYVLPDLDFEAAGPAGLEQFTSQTPVPDILTTGLASYRVTLTYSCNIVHRLAFPIVDVRPPVYFRITPINVKEGRVQREPALLRHLALGELLFIPASTQPEDRRPY